MAAAAFTLTLGTGATRCSDVYGGAAGAAPDPAKDVPYREISFQADKAAAVDIELGNDNTVSASVYGVQLLAAAPNQPYRAGGYSSCGPLKLSQFWAFGSGGKLHILAIPF